MRSIKKHGDLRESRLVRPPFEPSSLGANALPAIALLRYDFAMQIPVMTFVGLLPLYKYVLIFLAAIAEGPIVMTIGGFFLRMGYVTFLPLYLTLMAGDLAADTFWYAVGYWWGRPFVRRFGRFFGLTDKLIARTEAAFHAHQNKILFLSKITMGFGFALLVLITAGIARVPFRKYLLFNVVGQFVWTALLLGVGYFFGNFYLYLNQGLRTVSLVAFVAIIVTASHGVGSYFRQRSISTAA